MKSKLKEVDPRDISIRQYPYLGRFERTYTSMPSDEIVVFFTSPGEGVCVYTSDDPATKLGENRKGWNEPNFTHLLGEVILSNYNIEEGE